MPRSNGSYRHKPWITTKHRGGLYCLPIVVLGYDSLKQRQMETNLVRDEEKMKGRKNENKMH